jgi:16S rRNA (cytosine967-C5)-methyltransferase
LSRFHAYLRNASALISKYDGSLPLAIYLKQYFAGEKKFGSNDRKVVGGLCFQYFRLGHLFKDIALEDRLLIAEFVCRETPSKIIEILKPEWLAYAGLTVFEKIGMLGYKWSAQMHTPWHPLIEKDINPENYTESFFHQPYLNVRVRPGKKEKVSGIMAAHDMKGEWLYENTLVFPNATKLEEIFTINKDVVVQDAGSQKCGEIIKKILHEMPGTVWDACAASGGKSIQLIDLYRSIPNLWVSDIRESILHNLSERFRQAGIHAYQSFVADLTKPLQGKQANLNVDVALVDAPCTGSGTWSRTPEQHYFFNADTVASFSQRQLQICQTVIPHIKPNGYIIYITCSVFTAENQQVIENLLQQNKLTLIHAEVVDGTTQFHDSMYIAIMQKN